MGVKTKSYVIVGRRHGDDDATSRVYEAATKIEAMREFADDMLGTEDLAFNQRWAEGSTAADEDEVLYLDAVFSSETPIDEEA